MGLAFTQNQYKYNNDKRIWTEMVSSITSTVVKNITGRKHTMNWKTNIVCRYMLPPGLIKRKNKYMEASQG